MGDYNQLDESKLLSFSFLSLFVSTMSEMEIVLLLLEDTYIYLRPGAFPSGVSTLGDGWTDVYDEKKNDCKCR